MRNKTPKHAAQIVALKAAGYTLAAIATQTGVSISTVQRTLSKYPTAKGELVDNLIEEAKEEYKQSFIHQSGLLEIQTSLIADTVSQVILGREKAAALLEQLPTDDPESAAKSLRAVAAHATAVKAQADTLRSLLPVQESEYTDLPEIVVREMTDIEVKELRAQQEAEDAIMRGELQTDDMA